MPFVKIYIHCVWSTKNRYPFLNTPELRQKVWTHIKQYAGEKGIFVDYVSGYDDHCHCLISLNSDQTVQNVVKMIKGESSFWVNKNQLTTEKFEWQTDYFAVSVSDWAVAKIRNYLKKQEQHHRVKSFEVERNKLITKYGFD